MNLCSENFFWQWISLTNESVLIDIQNQLKQDSPLLNDFMRQFISAIQENTEKPIAQEFFRAASLADLTSYASESILQELVTALTRLENPIIVVGFVREGLCDGLEKLKDNAYKKMIQRLTSWFNYESIINDSTISGQFTKCNKL